MENRVAMALEESLHELELLKNLNKLTRSYERTKLN